jgi:hypothetical protein
MLQIESTCKEKCLGIKFEFSGPRTPQRIWKVNRNFQALYGRVRSMLNDAGIKDEMRRGIWAECASTATFYANILVNHNFGKPPFQSMLGMKIKWLNNLKRFGEMIVVNTKKKIQGKLSDRGTL